jgi:insertion element IS1 protein InsB
MTDYWKAYAEFLDKEKHIQSKAETFTVEGYNSLLRHFLARLKRRTKCYSKSYLMLYYSLILFFKKWNNQLNYIH